MARKPKPIQSGDTLWVMGMSGHTALGGFTHVSDGDKLYSTKEACQQAIDAMSGWLGMGDRKRYHPVPLEVS